MSSIPSCPLSPTHRNPRPLLRAALIVAAYLLAFIVLDFITKQFEGLPGIVAWYPPAGLTYTLLLVFGAGFAPAVTIALLISSLFIYRMPQPPYLLFLWALIISLIYSLAAAFLRKRIRFDWHLRKLRDVIWFVFTAVFVSALLAVLSVLSSALSSAMPRSEVLRAIFNWWIGESVGVLSVTPFLLIYVMPWLKRFAEGQPVRLPALRSFPRPTLSAIGQAASIALTLYWVFGAPVLAEYHPLYLIALPLIWIAMQRGFKGVSAAILALNSGVVLTLWLFRFDLAQLSELELLMIVNCIVGLLMGAVVTERKRAEAELQASHEAERIFSERLTILSETTTELSKAESLDTLCHRAVELGRERLDFDRLSIWFIAEDRTAMLGTFGVDAEGRITDERKERFLIRPDFPIWPVVQGQVPLLRLTDIPLFLNGQVVGQGTHVSAGLWDGKAVIGYIGVDNLLHQRPFSDRDCEIIRLYASAVGHLVSLNRTEKVVHHHLTELEVLAENSASLSHLLSPEEIGQKIIEILSRKLAWHHVAIRLYHPETGSVEVLALSHPGLSAAEIEEQIARLNQIISRPGKGLSGWVIKHGKPVRSGQVQRDRRYLPTYPGIQSGIYIPIQIGERTIGSITVESEAENAFIEQDENLLATLASQAAIAFENARLYQQAVRAAERRTILHRASQEIAAAGLDLESVYTAIQQAASELMTVDVFTIGLYDLERQEVEAVFLLDGGQRYPNMRIPLGQGFSGLVIQNRKSLRLKERDKEAPAQIIPFGRKRATRSVLAVPMFSGNAVIGAISVQSYKAGEYDEEDEALLEMMAAYAGNAIENARLFDQTRRHVEELGVLASVSSALRISITRDEIIPVILDHLIGLLNADNAALSTQDPATGENVIEQARGEWARAVGLRLKAGEGLIGLMAETYMPYESSAVTQEKNLGFPDSTSRPEAVAGIPLLVQGKFVGSLWVGRQQAKGEEMPVPFTPDEIRLLASVADMAANSIHRATLHEQAIRHAEQLVTVNEISHLLGETLELNQIYTRLTEAIYNLVPDICGLFISLYDQHLQNITCVCGHFEGAFIDPAELPPLPLDPSGEGHQSHVILTGEPLTTDGLDTRPFIHTAHKLAGDPKQTAKSGLYVPMIVRGATTGLIQLQSDTKDRFGQEETNLLSLVTNTAAIAIENARLLAEAQKRVHNLSALHAIDTAIGASVDMRVTLNILLEQAAAELKVDAAAVLLLNPFTHTLEYTASYGFRAHLVNGSHIQLGSGVAGQAALTRQMQSISIQRGTPLSQEKQKSTFEAYEGEGFVSHYAFPLVAKGQVQGVLEVYHRSPFQPDEEWLTFFDMLAGQAAIAIDNARLFEDLQGSNLDMVLAYDATIQGWSQALELRDKETEGHTQRVTDMTLRLAQMIGVPEAELEHVRRGALLHDIGKMGIPDSILLKPGKLTEEEWVIMRQHPGYAYEMLSSIAYLRPALDIPHYHHERWDGSGYPDGLKGEQIPLYARIFAFVDVYDALTSDRPYRPAWTVEKTIKYIRKQSGKHFDPNIVEAFLNLISEKK